jgi:hypothetical protein
MKAPKKPKMGKQPKASSSAETWERYYARENDKLKDFEAKSRKFESDKGKVKTLRKKVQTLKQKRSK